MKKDKMFQYAVSRYGGADIIEDTGLITAKKAEELWQKHYPQVVRQLEIGSEPNMCIWKDCEHETDYGTTEKEIDYRDELEIQNGKVYKKELTLIE